MFAGALDTLQFQKSIQWDLVLLVADREAFPISKTVIEDYFCVYSFIHYLHACPNMSKSNFHNYNFRVALARFFSWKQCKTKKTYVDSEKQLIWWQIRKSSSICLYKLFCPTKSDIISVTSVKQKQIIYFYSSFNLDISSTLLLYRAKLQEQRRVILEFFRFLHSYYHVIMIPAFQNLFVNIQTPVNLLPLPITHFRKRKYLPVYLFQLRISEGMTLKQNC